MSIRRPLAVLALVAALGAPVAALAADLVAPPVGAPITAATFKGHPVGLEKGVKKVYTMSMTMFGRKTASEIHVDVLDVKGGKVTLRTTGMGRSMTTTVPISDAAVGGQGTGFKMVSGGNEDVTVPAGTYRGALKIVTTSKDGATVTTWIDRVVGMVKSHTDVAAGGGRTTSTMELKSYAR